MSEEVILPSARNTGLPIEKAAALGEDVANIFIDDVPKLYAQITLLMLNVLVQFLQESSVLVYAQWTTPGVIHLSVSR